MKKIINHPDDVVEEMIDGIVLAAPNRLKRIEGTTALARKETPIQNKVALISGGGSGHEPAHAGYIGTGMLDAAVLGEVFTSPSVDQVYAAIKAVHSGYGVCLIVKNYTGDVMNFEMAAELATADGIEVELVIVKDDVAVEDSTFTTGRRGIAGTVFVHKIAGAKAEQGGTLQEIKAIATKTVKHIRSMGVAISPCTIPAAGEPNFLLAETEMEVGIGIHGEPGIARQELGTAKSIAKQLLEPILADLNMEKGTEVAVMINGMGSTPQMELYILLKEVHQLLEAAGMILHDSFVGEYMTSLEMGGASVTILQLDDELKALLASKSETLGFFVSS